jgi:fibronectin-binding autotransporter adhesin
MKNKKERAMRLKQITTFTTALLMSLSSLVVLVPSVAHAAVDVCTWTGTTNDNFNTTSNWNCATDGAAVPENGDSLVFDSAILTGYKTLNNDLPNASFNSISFIRSSGTQQYAFTINGNAITLSGGITANHQATLGMDINMDSNQTLTLADSEYLSLQGVISGTGNLTVAGNGNLGLYNSNTFTGTINVTGGTLLTSKLTSLGATNAGVTLGQNTSLSLSVPEADKAGTISEPITISGTGVVVHVSASCGLEPCSDGNLTLAGALTLSNDVTFYPLPKVTLTGAISGAHQIKVAPDSGGTIVIAGSSNTSSTPNGTVTVVYDVKTTNYTADSPATSITVVKNETAVVTGSYGDVIVREGGTLMGTGTLASIRVEDKASIAPGKSPGCLTTTGIYEQHGTLNIEIAGNEACSKYDQIIDNGGTILLDATTAKLVVSFLDGFKPKKDDTFTIIDNKNAVATTVGGTFNSLEEGATFEVDGVTFKITYKGGDGNDVVLTVLAVGTPNSGFSLSSGNPIMTAVLTTLAAGALYLMGRRYGRVYIKF